MLGVAHQGTLQNKTPQTIDVIPQTLNNNHALFMFCMHQEARVSNAVELMSVHVEHLKRRQAIESEEMLEVSKLLHRGRADCTVTPQVSAAPSGPEDI